MRDADWSRENLLRSDWLLPSVAPITTKALIALIQISVLDKNQFTFNRLAAARTKSFNTKKPKKNETECKQCHIELLRIV